MTTNDVLTKQNFVTKIILKNSNGELCKDLKVKVMAMRIEYAKVRKQFEADLQEFVKEIDSTEFKQLNAKNPKTPEDNERLTALTNQINADYNAYVVERGKEEVNIHNTHFTIDEYNEIVEVNAGNDVEINGTKLSSADFLEILYDLFVEE